VVGGYVYRGEAIPALSGSYFFGDFCTAAIWSFRFVNGMISEFTDRTAELSAGGEVAWISGFAEDSAGEIYIVDRGLAEGQGELWKIVPDGTTTGVSASETSSLALRLSTATPNPFSIKTRIDLEPGSDRSRLNAAVYSPAGRLVRELSWAPGLQGSGSAALEWDGRDARGVDCPSGMYLLRVSGDGQDARERLVLLR